jgi:hypothetical protein
MTKYLSDKHGYGYRPYTDTPISVGAEEWNAESRPPYICDFCHHTLIKLQNKTNVSWWCRNCNSEYDPEAVTNPSISYAPEPTLKRKGKEVKGGLAELQRRGLKISNYTEGKG